MSEPTLQQLEAYEGVDCYGCGEQAEVTDVNGLELCRTCAEACRLPEFNS